MHKVMREYELTQMKTDIPDFRPGDTIKVSVKIVEGEKERIQDFEGVCIRRKGSCLSETFTVRRVSYGVGMERIFPLHSPRVEKIQLIRRGKVRRAKLYYLRDLRGKKAKISEKKLPYEKILGFGKESQPEIAESASPESEKPAPET